MKITFNTTASGNDNIEVDAIKLTGKLLHEGITDPKGKNCYDENYEEHTMMFVKAWSNDGPTLLFTKLRSPMFWK